MENDFNKILDRKAAEFKKKEYSFFKKYLNRVFSFGEKINGKDFEFEIHVIENKNGNKEFFVMVEASKKILFAYFGKARYFAISEDNSVRDLKDEEVF
ncbi:MAG: hypothetical protein WC373_17175 [Smithella sp.]|jgi:lipopolysaccharide export LptBFGC system permease protein LptF